MKTAEDIMTKPVIDVDPEATIAQAIDIMRQHDVTSLLIQRKGPGDMLGFMSQTDVIEKVVAKGLDPAAVFVHEIMTKPVITVSPNCSLYDCAALMARADIRRVLVFDGKDIVGIVSTSDIFNAL